MKKLLLILLCLPMIGFGQDIHKELDDCGKKPKPPASFNNVNYKISSEYIEYSKKNKIFDN